MKQLTEEQSLKKEQLLNAINDAESELNAEIDSFNEEVAQLFKDTIARKEKDLNEKLKALRDFCDEVASEAGDHFDEQDEDWQNSDEGTKYNQWKESFDAAADISDIDIDAPDELEKIEVDLFGVDNISDEFDG